VTLDLAVSSLLVPPAAHPAGEYHVAVAGHQMRLRAVNGADLERAAGAAGAAAESIARSCVLASEPPLPEGPLTPELSDALSSALAALDPQADILLDVQCSACGHMVQIPFDPGEFLQQVIEMRRKTLDEEIHALAFYYHWTEEAVLELPLRQRRRYFELIAGELAREDR